MAFTCDLITGLYSEAHQTFTDAPSGCIKCWLQDLYIVCWFVSHLTFISNIFWCKNSLGLPGLCEMLPETNVLFLADYPHAGLIEIISPLFTSSFDVIPQCAPAFHGPGLSGGSPIGNKQLCTLFAIHILSKQFKSVPFTTLPAHLHTFLTNVLWFFFFFCLFQGYFTASCSFLS